jgi:hypothetical protein
MPKAIVGLLLLMMLVCVQRATGGGNCHCRQRALPRPLSQADA